MFWRPVEPVERRDVAVAVGQDMNRDFDTLAAADGANPTHIVTRRSVTVPESARHVTISKGDFFGSQSMSDEELRQLYNMAAVVVVPLKDVNQPTGYSVSLQAMRLWGARSSCPGSKVCGRMSCWSTVRIACSYHRETRRPSARRYRGCEAILSCSSARTQCPADGGNPLQPWPGRFRSEAAGPAWSRSAARTAARAQPEATL